MITKIHISDFKSIVDLTIELGRFNVIIGENGCGKTNILEAISFASAANQGVLGNETLGGRLRLVSSDFMLPAFDEETTAKAIEITVTEPPKLNTLVACIYDNKQDKWVNFGDLVDDAKITDLLGKLLETLNTSTDKQLLSNLDFEQLNSYIKDYDFQKIKKKAPQLYKLVKSKMLDKPALNDYVIYSPEETQLRRFSDESQILPLGRRGEGLFQYLKRLANENSEILFKIQEGLSMLDWFDGLKIPEDLMSNEYKLDVADKYLKETLHYFDQRSTNEGFLYMLFYLTLFTSIHTPKFFAIDNIESSFNPKLCSRLVSYLVSIAKENGKQVIVTTHNPYILDGLDLMDDSQRLFVVRRNKDGHTILRRIKPVEDSNMKLSEVWMKGFIGGLPDNF